VALFGWIMMGIAIWHFTVFLPDRFWAGIIGGFVGSVIGAVFFALLVNGFDLPSQDDTNVATILEAVPGTLIGLAAVWFIGVRQERSQGEPLVAFGRRTAH
jgi:hypothetical protein